MSTQIARSSRPGGLSPLGGALLACTAALLAGPATAAGAPPEIFMETSVERSGEGVPAAGNSAAEPATGGDSEVAEPPPAADGDAVGATPLQDVVVTGSRDGRMIDILPGDLRIDGPFGASRSLLDTPRAASPLTRDLLDRLQITEISDFARVVPNSFGATTFGIASLPSFRGQLGEIYQNGLRRQGGNNGLGLPISFNSVEQIDAVKGPPPVVFGASQRVGGFINLQTKRPRLDARSTEVTLSGGSYDELRQQVDFNQPLREGISGLRLSIENRNEDSFYQFAGFDSLSIFGAYRHRFGAETELNASLEFYGTDFTDNAGWVRPTQDLIDNSRFITGQGVQPPDGPRPGATVPGPGAVVSPTGVTRLPRRNTLVDPRDVNNARSWIASVDFAHRISDRLGLQLRHFSQYLDREGINQNSFVEIIDGAITSETRGELTADYHLRLLDRPLKQQTIFGLAYRLADVNGFSQFTTEADNPIDLTGAIENRRIPLTPQQQARLVELRPGVFVSPGAQYDLDGDGVGDFNISDTTDSTSHQLGVFVQHDAQILPRLSLLVGARSDTFWVEARDPIAPEGVSDPAEDAITETLQAVNGALTFKPVPAVATYFAFSYSESTSNSLGGGTVLNPADNRIAPENFATASRLWETGVKYADPAGVWYADLVLFDQTRSLRNRDGSNSGIQTQGVEAQVFWRAPSGFFAQLAGSYLEAEFDDSLATQDTRQVLDTFDDSRPDIVEGTGIGSPNFTAFGPTNARVQGLPRQLYSAFVGYQSRDGWGATLSGRYTKQFPLDFLQTVFIRDQFSLDASAFYTWRRHRLTLRADVFNLTNERNFAPVFDGGFFGATLVLPEEPVRYRLSLTKRWG